MRHIDLVPLASGEAKLLDLGPAFLIKDSLPLLSQNPTPA